MVLKKQITCHITILEVGTKVPSRMTTPCHIKICTAHTNTYASAIILQWQNIIISAMLHSLIVAGAGMLVWRKPKVPHCYTVDDRWQVAGCQYVRLGHVWFWEDFHLDDLGMPILIWRVSTQHNKSKNQEMRKARDASEAALVDEKLS